MNKFHLIGEAPQQCPKDFAFAFDYGRSCCAYPKDGEEKPISIRSGTCLSNAYRPCIKDICMENSK